MRCTTCGEPNLIGASVCVRCAEPLESPETAFWSWTSSFARLPDWLRWIIALPVAAIPTAIAVGVLAYNGLREPLGSGIIYAFGAAVAIFVGSRAASVAAPCYRQHVGFAISLALTLVFICDAFYLTWDQTTSLGALPLWYIVTYAAIPGVASVAAVLSIAGDETLRGDSVLRSHLDRMSVTTQWLLFVPAAVWPAAAFSGMSTVISRVLPSLLPPPDALLLNAVVSTAMLIVLLAVNAPCKKLRVAQIAAGVIGGLALVALVALVPFLTTMSSIDKLALLRIVLIEVLAPVGVLAAAALGVFTIVQTERSR